jgi:hypothetical protein
MSALSRAAAAIPNRSGRPSGLGSMVMQSVVLLALSGHYRHLRPDSVGTDGDPLGSKPGMDEIEREAIRAEGLDPDDPAVVTRSTAADGSYRCISMIRTPAPNPLD